MIAQKPQILLINWNPVCYGLWKPKNLLLDFSGYRKISNNETWEALSITPKSPLKRRAKNRGLKKKYSHHFWHHKKWHVQYVNLEFSVITLLLWNLQSTHFRTSGPSGRIFCLFIVSRVFKKRTFKDPRGFLSVIYHLFKERTFKGQRVFFCLSYITCFQGTYTFEGPRGLGLIRRLVYNVLFVFGPVASQPVVSGKWRGWRHEIIVNTETKYEETEPKDLKQNKGRSNILK